MTPPLKTATHTTDFAIVDLRLEFGLFFDYARKLGCTWRHFKNRERGKDYVHVLSIVITGALFKNLIFYVHSVSTAPVVSAPPPVDK